MKFCRVAVNAPINDSILTYRQNIDCSRGSIVKIPLGKRQEWGIVVEKDINQDQLSTIEKKYDLKNLVEIYEQILLSEKELELYAWMAKYYHYPLGRLIFDCMPKFLKRPRPIDPILGEGKEIPYQFTDKQKIIFDTIYQKLQTGFSQHLVHGVTGSGKSLIYLRLMKEVLSKGKSVHFLVPEINLTPQFIEEFREYLNCPIYTYHSSVQNSEKFVLWKQANNLNQGVLLIGVRSSLFVPLSNLGLIIIDEEHDSSFKQEDRCPYNARDTAFMKAKQMDIPIVLGSATPSMESYFRFKNGGNYYTLKERAISGSLLPEIELVDASEADPQDNSWPFHPNSIKAIESSLDKGEQALVYVNRLGYSQYVQCSLCQHQFHCPNCSVSLKYHKHKNKLHCHYCNYFEKLPDQCPECGSLKLFHQGFGTEKIIEVLEEKIPGIIAERFDRGEIKNFEQLKERLERFHKGESQVLVGTQMLSKGHNFKKVNLVIVLGMDSQLNFPDFRSLEKVYQQLTQVAGRSGRFGKKGRVLVQTMNTKNQLFHWVKEARFDTFYEEEIKSRKDFDYPPFSHIGIIYFHSRFIDRLIKNITQEAHRFENYIRNAGFKIELLGPTPSPIEKKVNKYSWFFLLKASDRSELYTALNNLKGNIKIDRGVEFKIDVDPYTIN